MELGALVQLVVQIGLPSALVVYFVWRGDKREAAMSDRIRQLERSQIELLKSVVMENTKAFIENTATLRRSTSVLERLVDKIVKCPGPKVSDSTLKAIPGITTLHEREQNG